MDNSGNEIKDNDAEIYSRWEKNHRKGKIFGGLLIAGVGCLFLAREMGTYIPSWVFTWQMFLIVLGIYVGIKQAFQNIGWLIMILIGSAFLLRDYMPEYNFTHYLWPVALIIVGIYVMLKPRGRYRRHWRKWDRYKNRQKENDWQQRGTGTGDDYIDISAVFGNVKKNIITKNFKGGEVNCVFGGGEINLSQADINGTAKLEINAVFGGVRLIVPSHWQVKSELSAVLGSVEDKRPQFKDVSNDQTKVLILEGNAVFGGIEIHSY